jgi:ribosomal protein L20A (L18A)
MREKIKMNKITIILQEDVNTRTVKRFLEKHMPNSIEKIIIEDEEE